MPEKYERPTCSTDPLNVTIEFSLQLLLPPEFEKLHAVLHPLPLLGKLPGQVGKLWRLLEASSEQMLEVYIE